MEYVRRKKVKHYNEPYQAHELTFSCYKRLPLLSDERACRWLIEALNSARQRANYSVLAFMIMPNHVHTIVYPNETEYTISLFLKSVKQPVSRKAAGWLEKNDPDRYKRLLVGQIGEKQVFRFWMAGGGYDRNITDHNTLMRMIEYIHRNPVRKGLVEDPIDWEWSSISH
jgi:putative transposase